MGHMTRLYGYIDADESFPEENAARIAALPSEHDEPIPGIIHRGIKREMFAAPTRGYYGQLITFGQYYNGVETWWEHWRTQFEDLLRTMYWDTAHVFMDTELWGSYHSTWERRRLVDPDEADPGPTTNWHYNGLTHSIIR